MDQYNILILMQKDSETGLFTHTVDSYKINEGIEIIENAYMTEEDGEYFIYLTLTTADVQDYQYYGIYDLYDETIFEAFDVEVLDGSGEYNPRWIIKIKYSEKRSEMEGIINGILKLHAAELERIMPLVIADKEKYTKEAVKEE